MFHSYKKLPKMKTIKKIFAAAILLAGFVTHANAQSTAYATTTAILVTPISIVNTVNMHFGTVASSALAGTVILGFVNDRTVTGGVTLPAGTPLQTTAVFVVSGQGTSGFSIALPTAPITLTGSVSGTLTATTFTCDQGATSTLVAGTRTLLIGGTLVVPANSVAGTYTNALANASALFVTVQYN
jgi:hypothetical protein